jgi:hypothetical protein
MDSTFLRTITNPPGGFDMGASSTSPILAENMTLNLKGVTSFSVQLTLSGLSNDVDGIFQLLITNDEGAHWVPVPDNGGFTFKAHVVGSGQTAYFIFGSATTGLPAAQRINLSYTRTAGSGKLTKVIFGVINN